MKIIKVWGAAWCPQCPQMYKVAEELAAVDGLKYEKLDADDGLPFHVRSLPYVEVTDGPDILYSGGAANISTLRKFIYE